DDKTWLSVDGQVLLNDAGWNNQTSATVDLGGGGWFPFEWRDSNGGGGAGKVGALGFGWDPAGGTNYTHPQNSNGGISADLFCADVTYPPLSVTGFDASDITVTGDVTVTNFAGSGHTYTFNLTPTRNPTVITVSIPAGAGTNASDTSIASASHTITFGPLPTRHSDLTVWYRYDEMSGNTVTDDSGNGHDGAMTNMSAADWVTGQSGGALEFDGLDDSINVPGAAHAQGNEISIAMWVYGDDSLPTSNCVLETGNPNRALNIHFPWSNSGIYWQAGRSNARDDFNNQTASAAMIKGSWAHWVFTKNADASVKKMKIYFNGVQWKNKNNTTRPMPSAPVTKFRIGSNLNGNGNHWPGKMDDFRMYDKAMSASDVEAMYNFGAGDFVPHAPTPVITAASPTSTTPIPVTVIFKKDGANAAVTGFDASDLSVTGGGAVSNFAGSGHTYTFTLTPTLYPSSLTVSIAEGAALEGINVTRPTSQVIEYTGSSAPDVVANLELWIDGNDLDANDVLDGFLRDDPVTSWTDKTGNGYNF
ncbi:MAG: LamG-like jellyroll fold domain-containing protein, partial [Opitutales bacterium]